MGQNKREETFWAISFEVVLKTHFEVIQRPQFLYRVSQSNYLHRTWIISAQPCEFHYFANTSTSILIDYLQLMFLYFLHRPLEKTCTNLVRFCYSLSTCGVTHKSPFYHICGFTLRALAAAAGGALLWLYTYFFLFFSSSSKSKCTAWYHDPISFEALQNSQYTHTLETRLFWHFFGQQHSWNLTCSQKLAVNFVPKKCWSTNLIDRRF